MTGPDEYDGIDEDIQPLMKYAWHLNSMSQPAASARVFYELMSGALVWSDETVEKAPLDVINVLRFLWAYRTSLMLKQARDEFKPYWERARSLIPNWIGFRPERCQPTPELLQIYRKGDISLRKCLRDIQRKMDLEEES